MELKWSVALAWWGWQLQAVLNLLQLEYDLNRLLRSYLLGDQNKLKSTSYILLDTILHTS